MTKKQIQKQADRIVGFAFKRHFNGVQVDMNALHAIMKAGDECVKSNGDIDACMVELVAKYRRN